MNINALMQQAQKMQKQLAKAQAELKAQVFEVSSNGGAIVVNIRGDRHIESISIDKDAIDPNDKEMLEDMIKIAINEAVELIDQQEEALNAKLTGGMNIPGF